MTNPTSQSSAANTAQNVRPSDMGTTGLIDWVLTPLIPLCGAGTHEQRSTYRRRRGYAFRVMRSRTGLLKDDPKNEHYMEVFRHALNSAWIHRKAIIQRNPALAGTGGAS